MAIQMNAVPQSNLFSELANAFGSYYLQQAGAKQKAAQQNAQAMPPNTNTQQPFNLLNFLNNQQAKIGGGQNGNLY